MGKQRTISLTALSVLQAFAEDSGSRLCGAQLINKLGIASGTLYPILMRFEKGGLLTSRWEVGQPTELRRPRRRLYKITTRGIRVFQAEVSKLGFTWAVT